MEKEERKVQERPMTLRRALRLLSLDRSWANTPEKKELMHRAEMVVRQNKDVTHIIRGREMPDYAYRSIDKGKVRWEKLQEQQPLFEAECKNNPALREALQALHKDQSNPNRSAAYFDILQAQRIADSYMYKINGLNSYMLYQMRTDAENRGSSGDAADTCLALDVSTGSHLDTFIENNEPRLKSIIEALEKGTPAHEYQSLSTKVKNAFRRMFHGKEVKAELQKKEDQRLRDVEKLKAILGKIQTLKEHLETFEKAKEGYRKTAIDNYVHAVEQYTEEYDKSLASLCTQLGIPQEKAGELASLLPKICKKSSYYYDRTVDSGKKEPSYRTAKVSPLHEAFDDLRNGTAEVSPLPEAFEK